MCLLLKNVQLWNLSQLCWNIFLPARLLIVCASKIILVIPTGSLLAFLASPVGRAQMLSWVICRMSALLRKMIRQRTLTVWLLFLSVCVMISLTQPGSVLIDLLNVEIDCREAEQPYWLAAFIVCSLRGARGEAPSRKSSYWLYDLMSYRLDECLPDKVTADLSELMTGCTHLLAWPTVTDAPTSKLIGRLEKWIIWWSVCSVLTELVPELSTLVCHARALLSP